MWKLLFEVLLHRPWSRFLIILLSLCSAFFGLASPFFQKEFIDILSQHETLIHWQSYSAPQLLFFAFICTLLNLAFAQLTTYVGAKEAAIMQGYLAKKLYNKTMELRSETLQEKSVGEIVSIYATDIPSSTVLLDQTLPTGGNILFPLILAPILLAYIFHIPAGPVVSIFIFVAALNLALAYRQSKFFFRFKKIAGDRVGLVAEWVQNIKTLRILGWIRQFEQKIFQIRKIETVNRLGMLTNGQSMNSISSTVTFALNIVVLYLLLKYYQGKVTTGTVMAVLWIVGIFLTRSFRQMPWLFTFVFDSWTSLRRIHSFLQLKNTETHARQKEFIKLASKPIDQPIINIRNLNLKIDEKQILKSINLQINEGEFVAIVGEVGAGKSMLLLSLIGETSAQCDEYLLHGSDAMKMPLSQLRQFFTLAPQESFIMSADLRQNVAFDYNVTTSEDDKIMQSLKRVEFLKDLDKMKSGLDLEIGERGVNLSGGQKQRISLARVDYNHSPIVLLDDSLSAIDNDTENKLLDHLFKDSWQNRTRILVTHRLTLLDEVDKIFFLENGKLIAQGRFSELLKTNEKFRLFTTTVAKDFESSTNSSEDLIIDTIKGNNSGEV